MNLRTLKLPEVKILEPVKHGDHRGFFSETYNKQTLHELGIDMDFVQDNQSLSEACGTLRGLHFQSHPFAQDKLVRVLRGRILDVAVDIRHGSPTFGRWVSAELSADNWQQILVPIGFAHGIVTLEPNTEILYKVSNRYSPECDKGLAWDDADLAIDWRIAIDELILSEKDQCQPLLSDLPHYFQY